MAVLDSNEMFFHVFQPKVQDQFLMSIAGIPAFMIKKVPLPKFSDPVKKIHYINTYFNYRGKRSWEDVQISMYDPVNPSGVQAVMDWARLGYEAVTGRAGYMDFYKQDVVVDIIGPVGDFVSEWVYKGAWVSKVDPGTLDWANDGDPVELNFTMTYDYAVLNY